MHVGEILVLVIEKVDSNIAQMAVTCEPQGILETRAYHCDLFKVGPQILRNLFLIEFEVTQV